MTSDEIAIILLGDSDVGKTSLLLRFNSGHFKDRPGKTLIKSCKKTVTVKERDVKLCIWDTSGLQEHRTIFPSYYEGAAGALLVYDVTKQSTFAQLHTWLEEFKSYNEAAHVMIVGNKNEDREKKSVTHEILRDYAEEKDLEFMEVSAKSGENVETVFLSLAEKILRARGVLRLTEDHSSPKLETKSEEPAITQKGDVQPSDDPSFSETVKPLEKSVSVLDEDEIYDYLSQAVWTHFS